MAIPVLTQKLIVHIKVVLRRIKRRMWLLKGQLEEERHGWVLGLEEFNGFGHQPVAWMESLCIRPRPGHPGITIEAVVHEIGLRTQLGLKEFEVVTGLLKRSPISPIIVAIDMEVAVVQGHMVKAQTLAGWIDMHLTDTLGLVARIPEGLGQGLGEIPRHLVFVAHPS